MANTPSDKGAANTTNKNNSDTHSGTNTSTKTINDTLTNKSVSPSNDNTKEDKQDKLKRFDNDGVVFKAKLIGSELVLEPRGDKMCQSSIQRLKAIIKGTNSHKRRIVLKISYQGVKVYDEKTNEILHHHEVPQISYIASDDTDNRTFGYVCDLPNKAHQFICFKTSGPAMNVMSVISALFEAVLEKKNSETTSEQKSSKSKDVKPMDSIDLVDDSGIMDVDMSFPFGSLSRWANNTMPANTVAMNQFSLPRPTPMMPEPQRPNRSLVYNHSSISLGDAALTRQLSYSSPPTQNDNYVDRYSVFHDIDNLPSIFESTSLGNTNNNPSNNNNNNNINNNNNNNIMNNANMLSMNMDMNMNQNRKMQNPIRRNPFDDDFFA